jgi:CDP-2,3-bis-(O-geranylgeranyl)-sn-glycerol synthase
MLASLILKSLYFFLPAYIANMSPVLFKWVPFFDRPIWEKKFGKNKTWRGLVVAIIMGGIIFSLQKLAYSLGFRNISLIDYRDFSILLGFLLGGGAIIGDLVKSYYKRKAGVKPGKSWVPFDQLDFVIGGIFFSLFVFVPKAKVVLILFVFSPIFHVIVNYIGYSLNLSNNKF